MSGSISSRAHCSANYAHIPATTINSAFCLSHLHAQNERANHMTYNDELVPEAHWRGVHVGMLWGCMASLTLPFLIDYAFFHTRHNRHTDRLLIRPSVYQPSRLPEQEATGRLAPAIAPAAGVEMVNLLEQGPVAAVGVPHAKGLEPVVSALYVVVVCFTVVQGTARAHTTPVPNGPGFTGS